MNTQSKTVAKRRTLSLVGASKPDRSDKINDKDQYDVEEKKPSVTRVPFDSTLSIIVHLATWTLAAIYFVQRSRSVNRTSSAWEWVIYLCEVGFLFQELHSAMEISLSLFGPSEKIEHAQYVLRGTKAPKVHVLVT